MSTASAFNPTSGSRIFDPSLIQHARPSFMDQMGLPRNRLKAHKLITDGMDVGIVERAATILKATPIDGAARSPDRSFRSNRAHASIRCLKCWMR